MQLSFVYNNIRYANIDLTDEETKNRIIADGVDLDTIKNAVIEALGINVANKILKIVQTYDKKDASYSKAIVLLAKLINSFNPDLTVLTTNEQNAFSKMITLADSGYSDSVLLNNALQAIIDALSWYNEQVTIINGYTTLDEIINYLSSLTL